MKPTNEGARRGFPRRDLGDGPAVSFEALQDARPAGEPSTVTQLESK